MREVSVDIPSNKATNTYINTCTILKNTNTTTKQSKMKFQFYDLFFIIDI